MFILRICHARLGQKVQVSGPGDRGGSQSGFRRGPSGGRDEFGPGQVRLGGEVDLQVIDQVEGGHGLEWKSSDCGKDPGAFGSAGLSISLSVSRCISQPGLFGRQKPWNNSSPCGKS